MNSAEPLASLTSRLSPMHSSGVRPCRGAAATFRRVVSTVSAKCSRRSEWPCATIWAPASLACGTETSPVQAPASSQCAFCTPSRTGESVPSTPATAVVAVKEGITKGCTPAGAASPRWSRRPWAQARASARVLFIFQLVPIHRVLIDGPSVSATMRRSWSGVFVSAPLGSSPLRPSPLRSGPWRPGRRRPPRPRSGPAPLGAEPARARPLETGAFSGLLEGSVVGADRVDLGGRGGVGVELEVEPDLDELLGGLEADHALAHGEHLRVVRQHRALHGVQVMGGDRADAGDLVRSDRHAQAGAADQQRPIGLAGGDLLGRGGGDVGVEGAVVGAAHADVEDRLHAVVALEQGLELLLVAEAGVVAADDDLQCHGVLLRGGGAGAEGPSRSGDPAGFQDRCRPSSVMRMEKEIAPGSGVPSDFSPSTRERPSEAVISAVESAAARATFAASRIAAAALSPVNASPKAFRKGTAASIMVLSPTSAPPRRWTASTAASRACTMVDCSLPDPSSKTLPAAVRAAPHSAPEVPPADSAQASPARSRSVRAPAPASRAVLAATAAPLEP